MNIRSFIILLAASSFFSLTSAQEITTEQAPEDSYNEQTLNSSEDGYETINSIEQPLAESFPPSNAVRLIDRPVQGQPGTYGPFNIHPMHSRKCLGVSAASTRDSVPVQQQQCLGAQSTHQHWYFRGIIQNSYQIFARHSQKYIQPDPSSPGPSVDGAIVSQYSFANDSDQTWQVTSSNINNQKKYSIISQAYQKCLDIVNSSTQDNTLAQTWTCSYADNQMFYLTDP